MVIHIAPLFYYCSCELMAKNDRGVISKGVMKHVKIGSANSTIGNFKLDFTVPASGFFHFPYTNVAFATRIFDQSFHIGSLSRSFQ